MTNFEFYTKSPELLAGLIESAVDDALSAEGCSFDLTLPYRLSSAPVGQVVTWEDFLKEEII